MLSHNIPCNSPSAATVTRLSNLLKDPERDIREISSKVIISSSSAKITRNFDDFKRKNGENKTRELKKHELKKSNVNFLKNWLRVDLLLYKINKEYITKTRELSSNQEEADTKFLLHTKRALLHNNLVIIRSPSEDVYKHFISMFLTNDNQIWIGYNTGNH